jgi:hypothetical protein
VEDAERFVSNSPTMRKLGLALFVATLAAVPAVGSALAAPGGLFGTYLPPVREDGAHIDLHGNVTPGPGYDAHGCKTNPAPNDPATNSAGHNCLPAGATLVQLADGRILYWDALEGTEQVPLNAVYQGGKLTINDQSRVMTVDPAGDPTWARPTPSDGGSVNARRGKEDLPLGPFSATHQAYNDAGLFCSDQVLLADGRVLDTGGTGYYSEPQIPPGSGYGVIELEGQRVTRIFDPSTNRWLQAGAMNHGRWYPSLVTLADGKLFVASGVTKLIKPIYPSHPADSGSNVKQTETYDPATDAWTENGASGEKSLPLFPRLHLLPNGHVFYDAAGQAFNPMGESYDEFSWMMASVYDPASKAWHDLGMPGSGATAGFRGSTFSAVLPLWPTAHGYTSASFLTAGGVLFPTPGSYFPVADSRIDTVDVSHASEHLTSVPTGPLSRPRWYSAAVPLPDGTVYAVDGADLDEVDVPGVESPIMNAELFTPLLGRNGTYRGGFWKPAGSVARGRTYHNTAMLLPDGRVLIGGNAPIPTGYDKVMDLPSLPGRPAANNYHDASFQLYEPPYWHKARPTITGVATQLARGAVVTVKTPDAAHIAGAVLMRNTAQTHLVDGDARTVELPVVARRRGSVDLAIPAEAAVAPAGPYLLFLNQNLSDVHDNAPGRVVPSKGVQVFVG